MTEFTCDCNASILTCARGDIELHEESCTYETARRSGRLRKHDSHADTMTAWQTPAGQLPLDIAARESSLDGISQCATTPLELDLTAEFAGAQLAHAIRVYNRATSRKRTAKCWAYIQCELWNARQDAIRAGALKRGTQPYVFVSDRYTDATNRLEYCRALETTGHADARV